jgi:hypothetical protein
MQESESKTDITWTRQNSPNSARAITLDKPRGVQSADLAGSILPGKMPESVCVLPPVGTGPLEAFQ